MEIGSYRDGLGCREFLTISFSVLLFLSIFSATTHAQEIQFYRINIEVDGDGVSLVELTLNFKEPTEDFVLNVIGSVEDLEASSNAGPVDCDVLGDGINSIACEMDLTETQKELSLNFKTRDFVKHLEKTEYFNADLSPRIPINSLSASIKLPEGHFLVGEDISSSILSYPNNASAHITGDSIVVAWQLKNLSSDDHVQLELLYEKPSTPSWFMLRMRHFILLGGVIAVGIGLIVVIYLRKSKNVVLSVLDEYERMVMDIISREGDVKQKEIVKETGLSKSKISRVVKSLSERGLIEVERRGRTNRLRVVKSKFEV